MKIYTRTGDKGETSLLGGARVSKSDIKIEAYGTVDELNAYIGLLRDHKELSSSATILLEIQDRLFTIGSYLAVEAGKSFDFIPELREEDITHLENEIDSINADLPEMRNFVLPGGHPLNSFCHISRCICRRAERTVIALDKQEPVSQIIIKYLNRLSDYLFILARKITQDQGVEEVPWTPRTK